MRRLLQLLSNKLQHSFLLRWVLANVVGWVAALHLLGRAAISDHFMIVIGVGLAGVLVIGVAQWWVLGEHLTVGFWWIIATGLAIIAAALIEFAASPLLPELDERLRYLLLGSIAGLLMAVAQWLILRRFFGRFVFWMMANLVGGALCAAVSLPLTLPRSLFGAAVLGLLTGYALIVMGRTQQAVTHHNPIDEYTA